MSDSEIFIRGYRATDRTAVDQIACDTADHGNPVERLFHDRRTVAELLVRYYAEYEPDCLWIAEKDGQVAGYLTGCMDTKRCNRIMGKRMIPKVTAGALWRGALLRAETYRLLKSFWLTYFKGGYPIHVGLDEFPAHLHINIRDGFRQSGIGRRLVHRFQKQVSDAGIPGIHVLTLGHNDNGRRFFQAMGFSLLGEQVLFLPVGSRQQKTSTAILGWKKENIACP